MDNKTQRIVAGSIIIILVFVLGTTVGYAHRPWIDRVYGVENKESPETISADFAPFWKTWNLINEKYPEAEKVNGEERVWGATEGLVASLGDPYSVFLSPKETKSFEETISGQFSGVGMDVGEKDKLITVIAPLKDSPAEKAGIKAGDKILKVDDTSTAALSVEEVVNLIRGKEGTHVKLTIYRDGVDEPLVFDVVRATIMIPTLDGGLRNDGIYVISLYNFSANSTVDFSKEIQKFKTSGSTKLILDLRGNPGGFLEAALDMASWFLPGGDVVVTEDFGKSHEPEVYRSKGYNIFGKDLSMVILVDGGSASASEILAGALSEHGVATLIGEQTFGKGSVQELVPVTIDTALKITVAKWLTPEGVSISEKGLTPEITAEFDKDLYEKGTDTQLNRAVEFLKTGK